MARANWKGSINFGLVNIPVQLSPATRDKDVHFHMVHEPDGGRIREKLVCEEDGKEVPRDQVVKGYALPDDQIIIVKPAELKAVDPARDKSIGIEGFVKLEDIDPVYFERSYHVAPDGKSSKAYALFESALAETGRVAIGRLVISTKEHLCAIRSSDGVLRLMTMHFADEVVEAPEIEHVKTAPNELEMARSLIDRLDMKFEPARYHDTHREKVEELLQKKAHGETIEVPKAPHQPQIADLTAALERSLEALKKKPAGDQRKPAHRRTRGNHTPHTRARRGA